MNEPLPRPRREPTQAAEGLPRWRWTLAEFERFIEMGLLTEDDRVELIGGEIVPMAAKGNRHEYVRLEIHTSFSQRMARTLRTAVELGWRPDDQTYCEPDITIFAKPHGLPSKVPPAEMLLLVEVADTTLEYDTNVKAALYARLGVQDYWGVNANTLRTRVHRDPSPQGYGAIREVGPNEPLVPLLLPELAIRLADLDLGSLDEET